MEPAAEQPLHVIELSQNARPPIPWTLSVFPDRWVFATAGMPAHTIKRENVRKWVDLEILEAWHLLHVTLDKKHKFVLKTPARNILRDWIGPPTREDLRTAFASRYGVGPLVMAGVMMVLATPWFMPAWLMPANSDPTTQTFDWVLLIWGASTFVGFGLSKISPHRSIFMIDVVMQLVLAAWWGYSIAMGDRSWWLALLIALQLFGAKFSFRQFKRFESVA